MPVVVLVDVVLVVEVVVEGHISEPIIVHILSRFGYTNISSHFKGLYMKVSKV